MVFSFSKAAVNFRTLNAFIPFNSRSDITREQVQYGVEYKPASMSAKEWSAVANLIFLRKTLSRENRRERERRLDIAERGCCDGLREASKRMGNQFLFQRAVITIIKCTFTERALTDDIN
ncbi:uncharacterized protein LOC122628555 [Vespula pensylvanica]|uniref:uncharacterized protein LOC122628555 n=1 Tax=Vespula pensylvanica TaxID=30213 RepID=UPI001CBA596C|nr:uncharacterized protein LOC122628555 [Vespula pensylvanica]